MFGLIPWREKERKAYPLANLRTEFEPVFNRFFDPWLLAGERLWDVKTEENEKELIVRAEMPGFEPEELEIGLRGNELTLKAEHKVDATEKKPADLERRYERLMTLPVETDPDKVEARYHNGVLEVRLPKTPAATIRKVPILKT